MILSDDPSVRIKKKIEQNNDSYSVIRIWNARMTVWARSKDA